MRANDLWRARAAVLRAAEPLARAVIASSARRGLSACRVRAVELPVVVGVAFAGDATSTCRVRVVGSRVLAGVSFVDGRRPARMSALRKRVAA